MKLKELHESIGKSVADLGVKYMGGNFNCRDHQLTSLKGSPEEIDGAFECSDNELTSLAGAPRKVGGNFLCVSNKLTSLEGAPRKINGTFSCTSNKLTSLKGGPDEVSGIFYCINNKLTSLGGAPKIVGRDFKCNQNHLTSLEGIHLKIQIIDGIAVFNDNPIKSHVLGLLLIDELQKVYLDHKQVQEIINKYLAGSRDVMDCQNELMDAGLDEYAQL